MAGSPSSVIFPIPSLQPSPLRELVIRRFHCGSVRSADSTAVERPLNLFLSPRFATLPLKRTNDWTLSLGNPSASRIGSVGGRSVVNSAHVDAEKGIEVLDLERTRGSLEGQRKADTRRSLNFA